jgi:hypothetical protein
MAGAGPSGPVAAAVEIVGRRLVPVAETFDSLWTEEGFGPLYHRIFVEAALPVRR